MAFLIDDILNDSDAKLTILPLASIWIPLTKLSLGEVCDLDPDAILPREEIRNWYPMAKSQLVSSNTKVLIDKSYKFFGRGKM
ncbi:hypothetical protein CFP56_020226 [Quercus suber]|uniref:Uncharacterized protein n=1 Tax=Quercus suber TaxID=58331 RepID=A0AAW0KFX7_QUESU